MRKEKKDGFSIVLIGAGNVGTQLGKRLFARNQRVVQVFSRNIDKAKQLGQAIGAGWVDDLSRIVDDAELYIIAVHDDAIGSVARALVAVIGKNHLVVHTSGATSSEVIEPYFDRFGVFYPLQSFHIDKKPKWSKIPICLFANRESDLLLLKKTASCISTKVFELSDEQRRAAHVAAVMVNNFSNYLFDAAYRILEDEDLSFDLLRPLILETAQKVQSGTPKDMQTGPAARGDVKTINQHLSYLEKYPDIKKLYELLTAQIKKMV